jgi:hypothetical protein
MDSPSSSSELTASLALLTDALDDSDIDIEAGVAALTADARSAVHSYLGLSVIISGDPTVAFTVFPEPGPVPEIRASMRMSMLGNRVGVAGVVFILYAGRPGAFVDLAADLAWIYGRTSNELRLELDQHLHPHTPSQGTVTLDDAMLLNQAIGVLITRGATPEGALRDIDTRAARDGLDRTGAAGSIVAALTPKPQSGIDSR